MNTKLPQLPPTPSTGRAQLAFTITEMMISLSLLGLVLGGVITSHLFGLRMYEISKVKLGASDEARKAISLMISEIRSAKIIALGDGSLSTFSEVPMNTLQQGTAIQINSSTNTNFFIRYFWDVTDNKLKRTTNGSSAVSIVADYITNNLVFTSEDYTGTVLTNNQNNRVIGLTLQFYQLQYPVVRIGPGNLYDFYQLRTKITRRTLE